MAPGVQRAETPPHDALAAAAGEDGVPSQSHTRTYQACIPCRRRKVRCDLGPVDNPHDPPCQRCRRESKECYFSATRRKRKTDEDGEDVAAEPDAYEVRNGRKRLRGASLDSSSAVLPVRPLTPGGSESRPLPLRRPGSYNQQSSDEEDVAASNDTAAMLQQTEVFNGHDALNLLYEAAGHAEGLKRARSQSSSSLPRPAFTSDLNNLPGKKDNTPLLKKAIRAGSMSSEVHARGVNGLERLSAAASTHCDSIAAGEDLDKARDAWSNVRFVRAGWFTAMEGMAYIDYFYRFLAPLTPITVPDFHNPTKHRSLLCDEPLLAVTFLTMASRYYALPGPAGASRGFAIHDRLWIYLQNMIDRMMWGQEQFGGGFCGAGATKPAGSSDAPRGLRSLGAIESLLILTEWHTRAIHFPPSDNSDELILTDTKFEDRQTMQGPEPGNGGTRIDSWLEPCWRSDRMCWSLLSNALGLAHELGIYSKKTEPPSQGYGLTSLSSSYERRKENVRKLLFVYITQTSGRLSMSSMLPEGEEYHPEEHRSIKPDVGSVTGLNFTIPGPPTNKAKENNVEIAQDMVLHFWQSIAQMMKDGNKDLFPSREHTRRLISSGLYREELQRYGKILADWRRDFDACSVIPLHMRHILNIEYEYVCVYVNSLALQAVVERCTKHTPIKTPAKLAASGHTSHKNGRTAIGVILPSQLAKWLDGDRQYIEHIVQATQNLLKAVVEGLLPDNYLKHAPVRTYLRIYAVSIILLKTFALGASESDAAGSLSLLIRATDAVRDCIVDDVHVGSRIAELLQALTTRVRQRIIRITVNGGKSEAASRAASRAPSKSPILQSDAGPQQAQPMQYNLQQQHRGQNNAKPYAQQQNSSASNAIGHQPFVTGMPNFQPNQAMAAQTSIYGSNNSGQASSSANFWNGQSISTSPYMSRASIGTPQLSYNASSPYSFPTTMYNVYQQDPLHGISSYDYDPMNPAISIMPPPSTSTSHNVGDRNNGLSFNHSRNNSSSNFGSPNTASTSDTNANPYAQQNSDWLALPLDPILQSGYGAEISQTGFGPDIGGQDMLDLLLQDNNGNAPWDFSPTHGQNHNTFSGGVSVEGAPNPTYATGLSNRAPAGASPYNSGHQRRG